MGTSRSLSCRKGCALCGTPIVVVREMDTDADGRGNGGRTKSQEIMVCLFVGYGTQCKLLCTATDHINLFYSQLRHNAR